jgi:Asp/Glu/hydantoin racemase
MKTVAAIYTAFSIIEPTRAMFAELMPEQRLVSIFDDSLIPDVIAAGNTMTDDVRRRFLAYCRAAEDMGADLILSTCSSMGDIVGQSQPFIKVPILKIDEPMIRQAVETSPAIAVLATAATTLAPTGRLVHSVAAQLGKTVTIVDGVAKGALQALNAGKPEVHDAILLETALAVADQVGVIVLAQASMARMQEAIARKTGKPVLSSMRLGLMAVKARLETLN